MVPINLESYKIKVGIYTYYIAAVTEILTGPQLR